MNIIIGSKYKFLTVLYLSGNKLGKYKNNRFGNDGKIYLCICDCGKYINKTTSAIKNDFSCGCYSTKMKSIRAKNNNYVANRVYSDKHKNRHYPTYMSWISMRQRCTNKNASNFYLYGGRGISITENWNVFENFLRDMGERPEGTTLDRINVDGNYEPSNCRWATAKEQNNNRRKYQVKNQYSKL